MEIASEEGEEEMPLPLNSTYGGTHLHMTHHHHLHPSPSHASNNHIIIPSSSPPPLSDDHAAAPFKKIPVARYRECLKNHAAAMGGSATDGCGEFMPSGDDGTLEALTCSACACHRNFHRKDSDGDDSTTATCYPRMNRKHFVGHHHRNHLIHPDSIGYHHNAAISSRPPPQHQMMMSYHMGGGGGSVPSESDEQDGNGGIMQARAAHHHQVMKKRFRTKFSQEQKEKMLKFAERVGWKIQKQEEAVVQQFCQEIGVKRRVLKVWMHNNKHTLANKPLHLLPQPQHHHQHSLGTNTN